MNKIKVAGEVVDSKLSKKISFSMKSAQQEFEIGEIHIHILKSCDLEFEFESISKKWKVAIEVDPNVTCHLFIYQKLQDCKVQYNFSIHQNSQVKVCKFQNMAAGREMVEAHLLESGAFLDYVLKDICQEKETIDYRIYHDDKKTRSDIKNNIVTGKVGKMLLQVSTFIPKGMQESIANQSNRIINFNDKKQEIRPNLYIEEFDVSANHSALIGKFSKEEMFYLESRGICEQDASRLLLQGFLLSEVSDKKMSKKIEQATKEDWR